MLNTEHNHTEHDHSGGHNHRHDHNCGDDCGHEYMHVHPDNCSCADCADEKSMRGKNDNDEKPDEIHIECHLHDGAVVISGALTVFTEYPRLREGIKKRLEEAAVLVRERGGIVGHIKASASVTVIDVFSVTDTEATVKTAPGDGITINVAAIVFLIEPEEAQSLILTALEQIKADAAKITDM